MYIISIDHIFLFLTDSNTGGIEILSAKLQFIP